MPIAFPPDLSLPPPAIEAPATAWEGAVRYMQTYYGVSEQQAARSAYPVYKAGNGLRDVSASLNLRTELDLHWLLLGGIGASRLLGPAADSPYTLKDSNWSASLGLAYRF